MKIFRIKGFEFFDHRDVVSPFFNMVGTPYLLSNVDHSDAEGIKEGEEYAITCLDYDESFKAKFELVYFFQIKSGKQSINFTSPEDVITIVKPLDMKTLEYTTHSESTGYSIYLKPKGSINVISDYVDEYIKQKGYYLDHRFNFDDLMGIASKSEIAVFPDSRDGYLVTSDIDSEDIQGLFDFMSSYHSSESVEWVDCSSKTINYFLRV